MPEPPFSLLWEGSARFDLSYPRLADKKWYLGVLASGVRAALVARGSTGVPREDAAAFAAERGIPVFPDFSAFVRDLLSRIPDGPEKKK